MAQCAECGKPIGMVNWTKWRQWRFCSVPHKTAFQARIEYQMKEVRVAQFLRFLKSPDDAVK